MKVLIIGHEADFGDVATSLAELGVDWTLVFAADASDALLLVQKMPPDVVVCELRPVGMDGTALLERIRTHVPQAPRIMLLDEHEGAQAMKALSAAHRLLNKPLRAEELLEAVEGIIDLRELLGSEELKTAVGRIDKLPPPPQLYLKVTRAVNDPDASMAKIADLVAQDPVTAAKVLRLCNSAFFSGGRTVTDVRTAVIRLGQLEMRRLVLAAEVFRDTGDGNAREAIRRRSLIASQLAGRMVGAASAEMASTAALLAEVGMLLPGVRTLDAAGELVGSGPHYAEAGAYLLGLWGLPMPIVEAVATHHQPRRSRQRGFWVGGAVHVARALAAGHPIDEDFLSNVGVIGKLPEWRRLAEELGARASAEQELAQQDGDRATRERPTVGLNAQQRAAEELLRRQPLAECECEDTRYTMLGGTWVQPGSVEAVEALMKSRTFDAVAVQLCGRRLQAATRADDAGGMLQQMRSDNDGVTLARDALDQFQRRLLDQLGIEPGGELHEAIEGARLCRLPVWPIDRDLDVTLQSAMRSLGTLRRLWLRLRLLWRERVKRPLDSAVLDALHSGDLIASALDELKIDRATLQQVCYVETDHHMAQALRDRARRSQAKRVLVVVGSGHLPGLKRALRAGSSAAKTASTPV